MATDSQTSANRINAQKCTGPTTPEGKAASSQNAFKTGLYAKSHVIATENRDDFEALIAEYHARYNPAAPEERCLVDDLIRSEWLGRRYMAATTAIWDYNLRTCDQDQDLGLAFIRSSETLGRAQRCITASQRNYAHTLRQLQAIQAQRAKHAAEPASDPAPQPSSDNATELLARKLVSFRQPPVATAHPPAEVPAETATPRSHTEDAPPIAA